MEEKWQKCWWCSRVFESAPVGGRDKFFVLFAYPGTSGYLHVGHMRGYTLADVLARYKRMDGYSVLFPCGTHASGNQAIVFASKVERRDRKWIKHLRDNGCPEDKIPELADPHKVIEFLNTVFIKQYWKRFGLSIDYRRFACTTDADYAKFVEWQFHKLKDQGLLTTMTYYGPACPSCGPVAVDPSETDISKGGGAERIELTIVPFKTQKGEVLPAATLRPETVCGVTNLWINPKARYTRADVQGQVWILAERGLDKLAAQYESVKKIGPANTEQLLGRMCINPIDGRRIPILASSIVDPRTGTGVVMSVPAHAPMDWIALKTMEKEALIARTEDKEEEPIPVEVIDQGPLAIKTCQEMGIHSLNQTDQIDQATRIVNKQEASKGRMTNQAGELVGLRVLDARDKITQSLRELATVASIYDLSQEVVCRCGEEVFITRIPDQWFIDYSNPKLKQRSRQHVEGMSIWPPSYAEHIDKIIYWFRERPCARKGRWLGTPLPFDLEWIIEPISDSTLYPAFYTINHTFKAGGIRPEQMTEEVFDHIFMGKGLSRDVAERRGIPTEVLKDAREEFEYWYPPDLNIGGKEHQTVHFPVYVMNHTGILNKKNWPRGILSNWYITMKGGKVSKSKGGAEPIPNLADRFTADGMRLYYANVASPFTDVEWDENKAEDYRGQIDKTYQTIAGLRELAARGDHGQTERDTDIDGWIMDRLDSRVRDIRNYLDQMEFRKASGEVFYQIPQDIRWYLKRGGRSSMTIRGLLATWIRLMTPFTPHLAEEVWHLLGNEEMVSTAPYPEAKAKKTLSIHEKKEAYLQRLIADIRKTIKGAKTTPDTVLLYAAEKGSFDENTYLDYCQGFLQKELGTSIEIHRANDPATPDPGNKKNQAKPLRPAIWLKTNRPSPSHSHRPTKKH